MAIFTIASNVGDLGADDGMNWMVPRLRASGRAADIRRLLPVAFVPVLVISAAFATILFFDAVPIAHLFTHGQNSTHLSSFLRILSPFIPVAALVEVLIAGTRGFDQVWPLATIWSVAMPVCRLALLPILLGAGLGLVGAAYAWGIPILFGGAAMLWVLWSFVAREHHRSPDGPGGIAVAALSRQFWGFSAPRAVASITSMALVWLDVLLVGYIVSLRMAGIYGVANRYMVVVTFVLAAAGGTIGPQVSRLLATGRIDEVRRLYQTATSWVVAVAWPISLLLAVFAPAFMRLFGVEFGAGSTALTILALMMLYVSATGNNVVILVMTGRTSTSLGIGVFTLALNLGANLLLIPHLGIDGAAIAWAISLFASNVLINITLYRDLALHPFGPAFAPVALSAVACIGVPGLIVRLCVGADWLTLVLTTVSGGMIYLLILWRLRDRLRAGTVLQQPVPVRVLIAAFACRPGAGSEPEVGWAVASGAARLGHDITVVTQHRHRASIEAARQAERTLAEHLHPIYCGLPAWWMNRWERWGRLRGLQLYNLVWQRLLSRTARRLHARSAFDVAHHVTLSTDWVPTGLANVPNLPVVWGPLGGAERVPPSCRPFLGWRGQAQEVARNLTALPMRRVLGARAGRRCALLVAQNEEEATYLRTLGPPVEVRPNVFLGPDTDTTVRTAGPDPGGGRLGVYVGRLLPWKGVHLALAALARSEVSNWELAIYGAGPERRRLERTVARLGLGDRVTFYGQRPRPEVRAAMAAADAFLFPSMREAAGWAVAEALAVGCPVVCLDIGGPPLLLRGTGRAITPGPAMVTQLAAALASVTAEERTVVRWDVAAVGPLLERWYAEARAHD